MHEVLYFAGEYADRGFQPFDTHTYLALVGDKYVKLRVSVARNDTVATDTDRLARGLFRAHDGADGVRLHASSARGLGPAGRSGAG